MRRINDRDASNLMGKTINPIIASKLIKKIKFTGSGEIISIKRNAINRT